MTVTEPTEKPRARPSTVPPPGARIAVVVNGNARSVTDDVISTLDQILMGGDLFVSRRVEEGADIARTLVNRGYGTVLTGGGDGTFTVMVTEVIKEARRQEKPLPRFGLAQARNGQCALLGRRSEQGEGAGARRRHPAPARGRREP